jgi:hypothetical protein
MLKYHIVGPYEDFSYLVGYLTPGCDVFTSVCECRTQGQATAALAQIKADQVEKEMAIRLDRVLRGLRGVYPGLDSTE